MSFPCLVYKCPGNYQRKGGTYSFMGADDDKQVEKLLSEGWFKTLPEAIEAYDNPKEEKEQDDNSPVTREELEEKAKELGIKFDGRTGYKKLLSMINESL